MRLNARPIPAKPVMAGLAAILATLAAGQAAMAQQPDPLPPMKEMPKMTDPAPIGSPSDHFGDGTFAKDFRYGNGFGGPLEFTYGEKPGEQPPDE